ncbi:unnamed protein product [Effrenium voratum]|uniref:Magnesium-dependent phosphatase 1 n=1 Tax=Effrenium voratum TaxID=2562239 RepID=A0AA36JJ41_9DINO|nr:unnamed protein product [Effrenium voratum]
MTCRALRRAGLVLGLLSGPLVFIGTPSLQRPGRLTRKAVRLPGLCVFDLDACLWDKEMYEMEAIPKPEDAVRGDLLGRGDGVRGVMSGTEKISLHKGALKALQNHADGAYPGMRIAVASSADTPFAERVGRKALSMLEVLPGLTVWQMLLQDWQGEDVNQIGRQPPLSPNKAQTHFPRLKAATGVPYDEMLFFDDCLWGDHCGMVSEFCKEASGKGVVAVRTPDGLQERHWDHGLRKFAQR